MTGAVTILLMPLTALVMARFTRPADVLLAAFLLVAFLFAGRAFRAFTALAERAVFFAAVFLAAFLFAGLFDGRLAAFFAFFAAFFLATRLAI
ncbi:MAG: hypothetical protein AB7S92_25615 [Parvibaculaceae bacterium]